MILKKIIPNLDLIIFCTPLGEYEKIILKINKYLLPKTIITDVGSSKEKSTELEKYWQDASDLKIPSCLSHKPYWKKRFIFK